MPDLSRCPSIEGNPDFYGIGIRIGIYLQWFSSWFRILENPGSAEEVHGVNGIFVFAIVIATLIAGHDGSIEAIELYIMLQFALGFFISILSTLGLRNRLLRRSEVRSLATDISEEIRLFRHRAMARAEARSRFLTGLTLRTIIENHQCPPGTVFSSIQESIHNIHDRFHQWTEDALVLGKQNEYQLPLGFLSAVKSNHLSWLGVYWRTLIASVIVGFNFAFWLIIVEGDSRSPDCRVVFLFSKQYIKGPAAWFFLYGAMVLLFPCLLLLVWLMFCIWLMYSIFIVCFVREGLLQQCPCLRPSFKRLGEMADLLVDKHLPFCLEVASGYFSKAFETLPWFARIYFFVAFGYPIIWLRLNLVFPLWFLKLPLFALRLVNDTSITATQLMNVVISLLSPASNVRYASSTTATRGFSVAPTRQSFNLRRRVFYLIPILANVWTLFAIMWFILSIELTLKWNNIRGINQIRDAGQLIPFTIGCASTCQLLKQIMAKSYRGFFNGWDKQRVEISITTRGDTRFKIHDGLKRHSI